jgi:hypothetical protein
LILLIFGFFGGGHYYNDGALRTPGFSIGTLLIIVLIILLCTERIL